jgi:hypothetical protein
VPIHLLTHSLVHSLTLRSMSMSFPRWQCCMVLNQSREVCDIVIENELMSE